jgi:hypothetical protein
MISFSKILILIIVIAASFIGCMGKTAHNGDISPMHERTIEEALGKLNGKLLSLSEVVGTAQSLCDSKPCIRVYVMKISPELVRQIPNIIDGYPVVVEETGEIHTLPKNPNK